MAELDIYTQDVTQEIDDFPNEELDTSLSFKTILNTDNIATILSSEDATEIIQIIKNQYDLDKRSREDDLQKLKEIIKLSLSLNEYKDFPWPGASSVIIPLIATAAYEFNAKCYPEIFNDGYIVKCKVYGKDDGQIMMNNAGEPIINPETNQPILQNVQNKLKKGERIATFLNWQLNEQISNWEEDCDKLFIALPVVGTMFKKTYPNEEGVSCVDLLYPDKIFVNKYTKSLDKAPITHLLEYYPQEVVEKIRSKEFIEFPFDPNEKNNFVEPIINLQDNDENKDDSNNINNALHQFIEQCCWLDLDKDGYPEPYTATIHLQSNTLVKLTKRFYKNNVKYNKDNKIQKIEAECYYVKYGFLPSPDGSFYDLGFGHLLFNTNTAINSLTNQLIDAGTLANTGGGLIAKEAKITAGNKTVRTGQWNIVDARGMDLTKAMIPFPIKEPSQTLFSMLSYLIESGKELAALRDIVTNDSAGTMAPTVMMALSEQSQKHFRAIFKRIYNSLKKEFKKILDINKRFPNKELYAEILEEPVEKVDLLGDLKENIYSIIPVADINALNNTSKLAQAALLKDFVGNPNIDQKFLLKKIFSPFNIDETNKLIIDPPPSPPSADEILAQIQLQDSQNKALELELKKLQFVAENEKMKYEIEKIIAEIEKIRTSSIESIAKAEAAEKGMQIEEYKSVLQNQTERIRLAGEEEQRRIQRESMNLDKETQKENKKESDNNE